MHCGFAFLASTGLYGLLAARALVHFERQYPRSHWWRATALDRTIDVINFTNALVATVLSSWALVVLGEAERTNVRGGKPSELAGWTVESVCGYIVVELSVLLLSRYRLPSKYWKMALDAYRWMVVFHIVALLGLVSVLVLDVGYPFAMWVVWSELTSVFLGLESFLEGSGWSQTNVKTYLALEVFSTLMFIFQRVIVFVWLLWLCVEQFAYWDVGFIVQFAILVAGTVLNTGLVAERIVQMKQSWIERWF